MKRSNIKLPAVIALFVAAFPATATGGPASVYQDVGLEIRSAWQDHFDSDVARFRQLVDSDRIAEAIELLEKRAEQCEIELGKAYVCGSYWYQISFLARQLGMGELAASTNARWIAALPTESARSPKTEREAEIDALMEKFRTYRLNNPKLAHEAIRAIETIMPTDFAYAAVYAARFSSFYRTHEAHEAELKWLAREHEFRLRANARRGTETRQLRAIELRMVQPLISLQRLNLAGKILAGIEPDRLETDFNRARYWWTRAELDRASGRPFEARKHFVKSTMFSERAGDPNPFGYLCHQSLYMTGDWPLARASALEGTKRTVEQIASLGGFDPTSAAIVKNAKAMQLCLVRTNWSMATYVNE